MSLKNWLSSLREETREALRYRELLEELVKRELSVRYKNSRLGVVWSLANPIVRAVILWAVFEYIVQMRVANYSAYLLAAFFPWTYFLTGVLDACDSVSKQMPLVRKVYFPRELLPLATTIANLRHFLLSLSVLGVYLVLLYGWDSLQNRALTLPPVEILLLPVLVVMQTLLIGGIALFLSALNVFYEDIKFLTAVVLDLLFYAVPIVYFIEMVEAMPQVPSAVAKVIHALFLLNPISVILVSYRRFLLHPSTMPAGRMGLERDLAINTGVPWPWFWFSFVLCAVIFVLGYTYFNRRKWRFVEQ